jgi:hypothetical protein
LVALLSMVNVFFAPLSLRGLPECTSERGLVEQRGIKHAMVWGTKKTEHAGAKKGRGAFYGRKADARTARSPSTLNSYSH